VAAQTRQRDRVALLLLFRLGLRKGELSRVQFKHYDGRQLTVFGKGGKVRYLPVVDNELRLELERHILDRQPDSDEFLLYPEKTGPEFYKGPVGVIWEDRHKPMAPTTLHNWWKGCLERAGFRTGRCTRPGIPPLRSSCARPETSSWLRCWPGTRISEPPPTSTRTSIPQTSRRL